MPKKTTKTSKKPSAKPATTEKSKLKGVLTFMLVVIVTAVIAGGAVYFVQNSDVQAKDDEIKVLKTGKQSQIENLQSQIEQLQADNEKAAQLLAMAPTEKPADGWEEYFPEEGDSSLKGSSWLKVKTVVGEPTVLLRQGDKEVWVFMPYDEDPTGLYLFFKDDKLLKHKFDEFNGLSHSLIDNEENWTE